MPYGYIASHSPSGIDYRYNNYYHSQFCVNSTPPIDFHNALFCLKYLLCATWRDWHCCCFL